MIIGISMDQEICLILGQVHSGYSKWETSWRIYVVRGEGKRHPDQIMYFIDTEDKEFNKNHQEYSYEIGNTNCSSYAM